MKIELGAVFVPLLDTEVVVLAARNLHEVFVENKKPTRDVIVFGFPITTFSDTLINGLETLTCLYH